MKKVMILISAMVMATFSVQANNAETIDLVVAAIDAATEADTNGTKETPPSN